MRSWSIPVGRLFGVDVRVHLTFLILPLFIFWTESVAHQGVANGPRDLALVPRTSLATSLRPGATA